MTNSTFNDDGFRDGHKGLPANPPSVSVYASEYMDGYNEGVEHARIERTSGPDGGNEYWPL